MWYFKKIKNLILPKQRVECWLPGAEEKGRYRKINGINFFIGQKYRKSYKMNKS